MVDERSASARRSVTNVKPPAKTGKAAAPPARSSNFPIVRNPLTPTQNDPQLLRQDRQRNTDQNGNVVTMLPSPTFAARTAQPPVEAGMGEGGGGDFPGSAGDGSGAGGGVGFGGDAAPGAGAAPRMSDVDFLAGDDGYKAQLASLMAALEGFETEQKAGRSRFDTDFSQGINSLGFKPTANNFGGVGASAGADGTVTTTGGEFDYDDENTAAGRGAISQMNDFASRGMLQSSDFGRATDLRNRNLNSQLLSMVDSRRRFGEDQTNQLAGFTGENNASQQAAKTAALMRRV